MKTTLLLLVCLIPATRSPLKVHGLFTDGMVLQREQPVPVWGTAEAGRSVTVTVAGQRKPAAVQYGWADNPECTLYNKEGLPASPFQIDR